MSPVKAAGSGADESKLFALLGIFFSIVGFIVVYAVRKEDKYAMYYAKQGLVLFIAYVIAWVVNFIFAFIPYIGLLLIWLVWILLLLLWIIGIIYSLSGEEKDIPIIGSFAKAIKL